MPLSIVNDDVEDDNKIVRRIGSEVNLGRIPGHYKQPRDWIETIIPEEFDTDDYNKLSFKSLKEWPDFGLAGRDNTFKLWAGKESEAVSILTKDDTNNLSIGCKNITTTDIPNWVKSKGVIKQWCSEWKTAAEVLGFSDSNGNALVPSFKGVFSLEAARSKLLSTSNFEPQHFISMGFGTGHTIFWTKNQPSNHTASANPHPYSGSMVASALSVRPVMHTHEILVDIPSSIINKDITLVVEGHGFNKKLDGPLPFWLIMAGHIWNNPTISRSQLRQIYKNFFKRQLAKAINHGGLPKPEVIVFSGGQEEHYSLAKMLSDILDEQGIKSVSGYQSASHCGIARLSYPTCLVKCEFDL